MDELYEVRWLSDVRREGNGIEFREYAVYAHVADREIEAAAERIGAAIAKLLD